MKYCRKRYVFFHSKEIFITDESQYLFHDWSSIFKKPGEYFRASDSLSIEISPCIVEKIEIFIYGWLPYLFEIRPYNILIFVFYELINEA